MRLGLYIKKPKSSQFLLLSQGDTIPLNDSREPIYPQQLIDSIKLLSKSKHDWIHNGSHEYSTAKYIIQPIESHLRNQSTIDEYLIRYAGNHR